MNLFDTCIITASDADQARAFERLLQIRMQHGLYPREIKFRVVPDPPGGRCGSGGATLWALLDFFKDTGVADAAAYLANRRVLVIHAGGESRRMPCYAPEGKLFAPVPVATSSIIPPVVLDLQLGVFLRYPWHPGELIVASGDAIIDFDTEYLPDDRGDICGFAMPASPDRGSQHGVFVFDAHSERVVDFHQKADAAFLAANACIYGTDRCALDIGVVAMSSGFAAALAAFGEEQLDNGRTIREAIREGGFFFDAYLDLMVACLPDISFAEFERRMEGRSKLPREAWRLFFETFHRFPLRGTLTKRTTFIHMGTLQEYPEACLALQTADITPFYARPTPAYGGEEIQPQGHDAVIVWNSASPALPHESSGPVVVEGVRKSSLASAAGRNVFVGLSGWRTEEPIPEGICIDERVIDGAVFRLVYGLDDTFLAGIAPSRVVFCNRPLPQWLDERYLTLADLWPENETPDLLTARLFPPDAPEEFTSCYWRPPDRPAEWAVKFRSARRWSIREVNAKADVLQREEARIAIRRVHLRQLIMAGLGWRSVSAVEIRETFPAASDVAKLETLVDRTNDPLLASYRRAHVRSQPAAVSGGDRGDDTISFLAPPQNPAPLTIAVKTDQIIWARAPVRLDLAGGWTDTPPYTMRFGGRVANVAVDLNGQPPIQVFCRRTAERHVRLHSIDLGFTETVTETRALLDYRKPSSPFALPKVALCLLFGLAAEHAPDALQSRLAELGCGIEVTLICAVPKGSGLGTSSILGGAIVGALARFFGRNLNRDELFLYVLELEQMLTTGGGWQDQIGGIVGGVKYIESRAGLRPRPIVHQLDPYLFEDPHMRAHFTLYYTGITRLAKNILQDVVRRVNEATPAYLFTHDHIKDLAERAREAVELRSIRRVASVLRASWAANQLIHPSTTNDEIEALAALAAPYSAGMKLLGAGGGGYALFVSRDPAEADRLREVLERHSQGKCARIVDFTVNKCGLAVSVS